jgi:hypothetical protein
MKVLIILSLLLTGCQQWDTHKYRLSNGDTVECEELQETFCGINLIRCTNGREYKCLHNVQEVDTNNKCTFVGVRSKHEK